MKAYNDFLCNKLQNFFESVEYIIGTRDPKRGRVVKIYDMNLYDANDPDFTNSPDFLNGYAFVGRKEDNSIVLIQKDNLTKISNIIKLTLEETKEEIKDFIAKNLYLLDTRIEGRDFRGYYKLNKIIREDIQTKDNVYLVLEVLLDLVESTVFNIGKFGRRNVKGSLGIKVGKGKETKGYEEIDSEEYEPSESELASAEKEFDVARDLEDTWS